MSKNRITRVFSLLLILSVVFSSLFIFSGCELGKDKTEKKDEIEAYFALKDQSNYSDDNWNKLCSIVNTAKRDINKASTKSDVALLACDAKVAMDGVQPKQSDPLQNGAYFLSDIAWEKVVRDNAKKYDKDDIWINSFLQENYGDNPEFVRKDRYSVVIVDNQIVISSSRSFCYQISQEDYIYKGIVGKFNVSFWMIGSDLYISESDGTKKYILNDEYSVTDEESITLDAPKNVNVQTNDNSLDAMFQWGYESTYGTLGVCVEFKNSQSEDFEIIKYEVVWMNMFTVQIFDSNLTQGENIVRFYHVGGPELRKGNLIRVTKNSAYVTYRITVDGNSAVVEEII